MTKLEMISNSIVSEIEQGARARGRPASSEEKLAEQHSVSVGTVQKALARLAQSGIIRANTDAARSSAAAGWRRPIFAMYGFRISKAVT